MHRNTLHAALAFVAVCTGLAAVAAHFNVPQPSLDPETLCPLDAAPLAYTALVLDATDPWSEEQLAGLRARIRRIATGLRTGEKFVVFELPSVAVTVPKPKFAMCSPGSGSDADPMTQGPRLLQARFEEQFMKPLDDYVSSLATLHSARSSPLLELISEVAARDDFRRTQGRRSIHLGSDLLQNFAGYDHYHGRLKDYAEFAATGHGQKLKAELHGAEVYVLYLINPRASERQGRQHIAFYRDYIAAGGGTLIDVEPL